MSTLEGNIAVRCSALLGAALLGAGWSRQGERFRVEFQNNGPEQMTITTGTGGKVEYLCISIGPQSHAAVVVNAATLDRIISVLTEAPNEKLNERGGRKTHEHADRQPPAIRCSALLDFSAGISRRARAQSGAGGGAEHGHERFPK